MNIYSYTCYRTYLAEHMKELKDSKPQLSLRSLAQRWAVSYSRLCEVTKGRGHFRLGTTKALAFNMGLNQDEQEYFISLYQRDRAKTKQCREAAEAKLSQLRYENHYQAIELDQSKANQWYHYTILFMVSQEPYLSLERLAERLGFSHSLVEEAVLELQREGLISLNGGQLHSELGYLKVHDKANSQAIQQFHRSMISKSLQSMKSLPSDQRYFCSHIFTMAKDEYQEICRQLSAAIAKLSDRRKKTEAPADVFCLSAQLFPLSKRSR